MKLKVRTTEYIERETDLDLPVYLCFQDELCNDELVKITQNQRISIKFDYYSVTITIDNIKDNMSSYNINTLENHITSEEYFNKGYSLALKILSDAKS